MTGMKGGAGDDPFADDEDIAESESTESIETPRSDKDERRMSSGSETSSAATRNQQMQIPYKFRRDGVQDGRDRVPLFLQGETKSAEREALRELEDRFDANVPLTDLREALVEVGLEHLDDVEGQLEQWGLRDDVRRLIAAETVVTHCTFAFF